MSWMPAKDPVLGDKQSCDALDVIIVPRVRDLGDGFSVISLLMGQIDLYKKELWNPHKRKLRSRQKKELLFKHKMEPWPKH